MRHDIAAVVAQFTAHTQSQRFRQVQFQIGICHHFGVVHSQHIAAVSFAFFKVVALWRKGEAQV